MWWLWQLKQTAQNLGPLIRRARFGQTPTQPDPAYGHPQSLIRIFSCQAHKSINGAHLGNPNLSNSTSCVFSAKFRSNRSWYHIQTDGVFRMWLKKKKKWCAIAISCIRFVRQFIMVSGAPLGEWFLLFGDVDSQMMGDAQPNGSDPFIEVKTSINTAPKSKRKEKKKKNRHLTQIILIAHAIIQSSLSF